MIILNNKVKILLLCIPLYPIQLIGEWYNNKTSWTSKKFSFIEESKEYWKDVVYHLKD